MLRFRPLGVTGVLDADDFVWERSGVFLMTKVYGEIHKTLISGPDYVSDWEVENTFSEIFSEYIEGDE